jgi:RNA-directed DNA polymerase
MVVKRYLEPILEALFHPDSYGYRPAKSALDAVGKARRRCWKYNWVLDLDIKGFFDNIDHSLLMRAVRKHTSCKWVLLYIQRWLEAPVQLQDGTVEERRKGTPQGSVISPLLANIYLNPLDHEMARRGWGMVRYADDFVILCESEEEAQEALEAVREWTEAAGLELHPTKTRIVDVRERGGFEFLGYHFERGYRWPRKKSVGKLKATIREKTRRGRSGSMKTIIEEVNRSVRGWFEYFKHGHWTSFEPLDGWIRRRLRTIQRRRHKRKGMGYGRDHQRWPNAYFAELGLISMALARAKASQSQR